MGFREYAAEFTATFLLLLVGLSAVSVNFGDGSPIPSWIPNEAVRRLLTGILFAGGATAIVYSPLGQRSGGHLNPAVTLAFLRLGKMTRRSAAFYIVAQILGALVGAIAVRALWGSLAQSVNLGVTVPGVGGPVAAFFAEIAITFGLVTLILRFVDRPMLMKYTAAAAGTLVALLVFVEAPVSGTSLNPARSLGPAIASGVYSWVWIYLIAPPIGALLAVWLKRRSQGTVKCGKLFHTDRYVCRFVDCKYTLPGRRGAERPLAPDATMSQRRGGS